MRTVPRASFAPPDAARLNAAEAAAMVSAWLTSSSAAGVGLRPCGEREDSDIPNPASSAST